MEDPTSPDTATCDVGSCPDPVARHGLCATHRRRLLRYGDVLQEPPPCSVESCEREVYSRGLCEKHYRRVLRHGDDSHGDRPDTCAVEPCTNPPTERGWCHGHYQRWKRTGDVQADIPLGRRRQPETCGVGDPPCGRPTSANGMCRTHNARRETHGDPLPDLPVRRSKGGRWLSHGYVRVVVPPDLRHVTGGKTSYDEHRLVMALHLGRELARDEVVHHRNGDRTDNRIDNLELWSTYQPKGQRVHDKVAYALEILGRYAPEELGGGGLERVTRGAPAPGPEPLTRREGVAPTGFEPAPPP